MAAATPPLLSPDKLSPSHFLVTRVGHHLKCKYASIAPKPAKVSKKPAKVYKNQKIKKTQQKTKPQQLSNFVQSDHVDHDYASNPTQSQKANTLPTQLSLPVSLKLPETDHNGTPSGNELLQHQKQEIAVINAPAGPIQVTVKKADSLPPNHGQNNSKGSGSWQRFQFSCHIPPARLLGLKHSLCT